MVPLLTPSVITIPPQEGQAIWVLGDHYTIKVAGEATQGAFSVVECFIHPGSGIPPHLHHTEAETFYILEGTLTLWAANQHINATQGTFVHIPRSTIHAFQNESNAPVKLLLTITPAGFEQFFVAIGVPVSAEYPTPPPVDSDTMEKVLQVAPLYNMEATTSL